MFSLFPGFGPITQVHLFATRLHKQWDSSPHCICFPGLRLSYTFLLHLLLWAFVITKPPPHQLFYVLHRLISKCGAHQGISDRSAPVWDRVTKYGLRWCWHSPDLTTSVIWGATWTIKDAEKKKIEGNIGLWNQVAARWPAPSKNLRQTGRDRNTSFLLSSPLLCPSLQLSPPPKPVSVSLSRSLSVKSSGH